MYTMTTCADIRKAEVYEKLITERCRRDNLEEMEKTHFINPSYSFLLPPFSARIAQAIGLPARQILLKCETTRDNIKKHKGIDDRAVLQNAIYSAYFILYDKPREKPTYYTAIGNGEYYDVAGIDFDTQKRYIEIVDWRHIRETNFELMLNAAGRNGGFIHLVHGVKHWL